METTRPLLLILAALTLGGCATMDKSECRTADWQTIGIEDGARGRPISYIGNHRKACAEYGVQPDLAQYRLGHANGIARFCTDDNGFSQGRAGRAYQDVCPQELRGQFLAGYDTGLELYQLNRDIEQMQRQVEEQKGELVELENRMLNVETLLVSGAISAADRRSLLQQFKQLQSHQALLEAEIRNLEIAAARKQGEYDVLDASHGYY